MSVDTAPVLPIDTPYYTSLPPAARHAITTHMPTWDLAVEFSKLEPAFFTRFKDMYPRMLLHKDIKEV